MAALGLLVALLAAVVAMSVASTAEARKDKGALPPGLAKKLPAVDDVVDTVKRVPPGLARKLQPSATSKPAKPPKPGKAKGPKAETPPQATPSTPTPATPAAAPTTPTVATPSEPARTSKPVSGAGRQQKSAPGSGSPSSPADRSSSASRPSGSGATDTEPSAATSAESGGRSNSRRPVQGKAADDEAGADAATTITRTVSDIVHVVPGWIQVALAALGALSLGLAAAYVVSTLRARSLARQRVELLGEVGLLQSALLPPVPERLGDLATSVAYRPADGPGAGGDFYDVLALPAGRVGFILGDVSGHGRAALERTAFMRYTLRAYLEAGLEPRTALQVAGRVIGDGLGGDFATVLLAVHDPRGGSLTYATAGHPAPILTGGRPFEPVLAGGSPPIGVGESTGQRQTTVPLTPGTVACLYTDGLIEARTEDGLLGRERLEALLSDLGRDATAAELIESVSQTASASPDDMAACLMTPTAGVITGGFRTEQLELSSAECDGPLLGRFLEQCGVDPHAARLAEHDARKVCTRFDGVVAAVEFGSPHVVSVLPRNVESIEAASLRAAAAR